MNYTKPGQGCRQQFRPDCLEVLEIRTRFGKLEIDADPQDWCSRSHSRNDYQLMLTLKSGNGVLGKDRSWD